MKASIYSLNGSKEGDIELPNVFNTPYRPDVIHKAFIHLQTLQFQPKGTDPLAGERTSAESRNTGLGIARLARVKGSGFPRAGHAAGVSGVVKGRATHPPTSEKVIIKRLNKKEKALALASAIAATAIKDIVTNRGHIVDTDLPLIVSDDIENISKAKELLSVFKALKLDPDIERVRRRIKRRTGTPRMRGRAKRVGKSVLIVVKNDEKIKKAAGSIPGVDVTTVDKLSVLQLAPGSVAGRLVLWSKGAIESLDERVKVPLLEIMKVVR
ncbi:MAG: 50S ribosomal protein L4 [Candidatus Nitrosocaldaceae archaeon]|nr:MAG: 50S ribosomal protein L4 [Candidatus Nitrosocaldaceae archaeon]